MKKNLNFRKTFPINVFSFEIPPSPLGVHRLRPSFSGSFQFEDKGVYGLLKTGKVEIFRLDLWKKPSFLVCMLGRPLIWTLLALAAAHWSSLLLKPFALL